MGTDDHSTIQCIKGRIDMLDEIDAYLHNALARPIGSADREMVAT